MEHKDVFDLSYLIAQHIKGVLTFDEQSRLESWLSESDENRSRFYRLVDDRKLAADFSTYSNNDKGAAWKRIVAETGYSKSKKVNHGVLKVAVAASVILMLSVSGYFYFKQPRTSNPTQLVSNDIAPGKNAATLTLANGKRIILSTVNNGHLTNEAGVSITKTADGQIIYTVEENVNCNGFNTLSTARGETYKVNLPDGTQVWLNAASSLTYPVRFSGADRKVHLTGEGYFEVAKDKLHPFKVNTGSQEVTVLGTHFNINAYSNERSTRTTLLEGSVKITANNIDHIIEPGQQAMFTNGQFKVDDIDTELATAWKNNKFIFDNDDIQYIMRMVERWYNVQVVYDGPVTQARFGGAVSRYENASEVLKTLESTDEVHFKIEGRKIIVTQ